MKNTEERKKIAIEVVNLMAEKNATLTEAEFIFYEALNLIKGSAPAVKMEG